MEFDLENPLTVIHELESNSCPHKLFIIESDHMPSGGYFDAFVRQEAVTLILQQEESWILRLLAASCISLAGKMLKTDFSASMFHNQGGEEGRLIFDQQAVRRMETVILGALNWRMRSITPFCFFDFFIGSFHIRDPPLLRSLRDRASHIIFKSQREINFLEFKPSIIAASALLLATQELLPRQLPLVKRAFLGCAFVNEESLLSCFSLLQGIIGRDSHPSTLASNSLTDEKVLGRHALDEPGAREGAS